MAMLTLDDAVKVAKQFCDEDEETLRIEFEQKCWLISKTDDPISRINSFLMDINPKEICAQIENDHLGQWCQLMQAGIRFDLVQVARELRNDV